MLTYEGYATPAEFEAGYANAITPELVAHWESIFRRESADALARLPCRRDLPYGPHAERNRLDFFPAAGDPSAAPLLIAIHGGLWCLFDKWMMHGLAGAFTGAGFHVATINYPLAPGHSLDTIVEACRAATAWLYRHAAELGVDRQRISVLGHSAAGQLCTLVASTRWGEHDAALPVQIVHRCIGVSGFYDIEPFGHTGFAAMTRFAPEDYHRYNPPGHVAGHLPPTLLVTGGLESSLLQQMMAGYADVLRGARVPVDTLVAPPECHFSVLHQFGRPESMVFQAARAFLTHPKPGSP